MGNAPIGHIFNIQKFSLHDGPGIRTTIFFKGCNLRCKWCANPESQRIEAQLTLDQSKCLRCGKCVSACPMDARQMDEQFPCVDMRRCNICQSCISACPARAINVEGESMNLDHVVAEALKDLPFYQQSGGGVTFSGGEVLLQTEFATALARVLRENGVHIAIETAAAVPSEDFLAFLREIDYVFVDLKHHDSARHLQGTGIGNEQIIENIRLLAASGMPYLVRIPVIPDFNDAIEDAQSFARLLLSIGVNEVQLLPFHQFGERKYDLLGQAYQYSGQKQLHAEDLEDYRQAMLRLGLQARF